MKRTGFIVTIVLLIIAIVALIAGLLFVWKEKQKVEEVNVTLNNTIEDLEEKVKTLNDTIENLKKEVRELDKEQVGNEPTVELTEEDYVAGAFEKYLKEISAEEGMELSDYRIDKVKIVDRDELEGMLEFEDSIPAEVTYSVKPASEETYMNWIAGNGEVDGEWIKNKFVVVEVANTTKGYAVMNIGTGW